VRDLHDRRAGGLAGHRHRLSTPEVALRHGAGVETETTVPAEAYAPFPKWRPGRPETVELPFG
jgi:hypothetical protein